MYSLTNTLHLHTIWFYGALLNSLSWLILGLVMNSLFASGDFYIEHILNPNSSCGVTLFKSMMQR